jgi:thiamine-phosphate pyrophosphorylase
MDAAPPRLLLVSPPFDAEGAAAQLDAALAAAGAADVGALLLRPGGLDDAAFARLIAAPLAAAQAQGIAVLLENRPGLLAASGADGVHLTFADKGGPQVKDLRSRFGPDVILGAGCGASRHLAMTAGEQGADYVGFGNPEGLAADPETLAWWQAVMTPPQVAFGAGDLAAVRQLAAAGADFVAAGPALWAAGGDPAAAPAVALRALQAALAEPA